MTFVAILKAIFALLVFSTSACADLNSMQADALLAENAKHKAEIVRSQSKIAQQAAEIALLKAEIARQHAKQNTAIRLDSPVGTAKATKPATKSAAKLDHGILVPGASNIKALVKPVTNTKPTEPTGTTVATAVKAREKGRRTCPGRCQGKCSMPPNWWDAACKMKKAPFKWQTSPKRIKQVGTAEHPKWSLIGNNLKGNPTVLGSVSCPCNTGGKVMTEDDAIRTIVGQVAAIGIPHEWLGQMCKKLSKGLTANIESWWNAKVTLSTIRMLKCWKRRCSGAAAAANNDASAHGQLSELLEDAADNAFGGGAMC